MMTDGMKFGGACRLGVGALGAIRQAPDPLTLPSPTIGMGARRGLGLAPAYSNAAARIPHCSNNRLNTRPTETCEGSLKRSGPLFLLAPIPMVGEGRVRGSFRNSSSSLGHHAILKRPLCEAA